MRKNKTRQRLTAMVLCVIMVVGMVPVAAQAETGTFPIGTSGEITAFEILGSDIAMRSVPLGTSEKDLDLPDTLTATIRLLASKEEPVLDSGETKDTMDSADTVSGSAIGVEETGDGESDADAIIPEETQSGSSTDEKIASPSDAEESDDSSEAAPVEEAGDGSTTVSLSVTWVSTPEYDGETAGEYIFTPEIPEDYTLASGVGVPVITVEVGATAPTGTVTAFDELPENVRWQNTTAPEFPETVSGTVEGETVQIPVTWDTEQDYEPENPQRGLYVFTAVLGEGYIIADGVELPRITVYIPQSAGRMVRMAGGGTTDSPLEITTAAQLAEIATLVNARQNGLELFLFNNAGAKVSLKLMNEIDLSAYSKGEGWVPIGTYDQPFKGIFDGNGKTITGLYISRSEQSHVGLFGCIIGGTIKNLTLQNVSIEGNTCVGGVTGSVYNNGIVQGCSLSGIIYGKGYTGSVVGFIFVSTVENCYSSGSMTSTGTYAGGVVGRNNFGTVKNCYSTASVIGTVCVGGVVGTVSKGSVQNCAALNVTVTGANYVGRVVGIADSDPILSGNIAFSGMTLTQDGSAKTLVEGEDQVDGESKTAAAISAAGFFEALFGDDQAWIYAESKLPILAGLSGQSNALPAYITGLAGTGTSEDPYRIHTAADLKYMADMFKSGGDSSVKKYYRLENDIDLSVYGKDYDGGKGWAPIGAFVNAVFDGNGKTITGLYISRSNENNIGLFSQVTASTIQNLFLEGIYLHGDTDYLDGKIGGLAGQVSGGSTISGCAATGSVTGEGKSGSYCAGGLVGLLEQGSTFNNCAFYGTVSAKAKGVSEPPTSPPNIFAGGIAGRLYQSGAVTNCISVADVSSAGESAYAGGVAGQVDVGSRIALSAALGTGGSADTAAGRIAGVITSTASSDPNNKNYAWSSMKVNGSTVSGTANNSNGEDTAAAAIQTLWTSGALKGWDTEIWTLAQGKLPVLTGLAGQNNTLPSHISGSYFAGAGTSESDPYLIKTAADLAKLAVLVNAGTSPYASSGRYYRLEKDIDLSGYASGEGWMPIGGVSSSFKGIFDGDNKTITGLTINRPAADYIGLFGYLYPDSKVQNIRIIDANVIGKNRVGGVSGYAWGATVENCAVIGNVSGVESVGGTVGRASSGTLENCYSSGSVTGSGNYVGGIIGYLEYAATTVQRCYSDSRVSGNYYVGGVAGEVGAGSVENCYSTGNVTGGRYVGGVAGSVGSGSAQNCYSTSSVTGTDEYVGGIAGVLSSSGTAKNCVALNPSINAGTYNFGRVVGSSSSGTLLNNYAFSRISGTWANKGIGAKDGADVTSQTLFGGSFWTATSNWNTSAWDDSVWTFAEGKLPVLQGLAGQGGNGGLYLTARDIQYATVSSGSFTYNGSEQIPTVTFDGETLIKNTDYIVSITSTDGNGTSAGTNAGTVTLTITGIGSFYGTKNITYIIGKKTVIITPHSGQSKKYGAVDPVLTFDNNGGLTPGVFEGKLSRGVYQNVGTYAISLGDLSAGGNYELSLASGTVNFTIEQARVTEITAIVENVNKTAYEMRGAATAQEVLGWAGLPSSVSVLTDGGTAMLPITWSTATAYNIKGTEYAVIGTLTGNENIDANSTTKSITVTVTPVTAVNPTFSDTLVVINSDSSATAAELGDAILPASGSITIDGVSVTYTINWNGGETLDRTMVGNEQTFNGVISYDFPPTWLTLPSDFTVSRKATVTDKTLVTIGGITAANKAYDGAVYAPSGTVTVTGGSVPVSELVWKYESTDSGSYNSASAPTNAGAYKLTISVPDSNANYIGSEALPFTIAKREITLFANNKTVIKGGTLPGLTYRVDNLASGEIKADALNAEPVLACPTFNGNTPGSYTITLTGGTATDNYTITNRESGILTVAEQTYTITFNLNGGTRTGGGELTQTVAEGGAATVPTVYRSGYTFTGWDKAFTNVASNLAVTAGWSYNGGGGGGGGSSTVPSAPSAPEKKPDQPVTAMVPITATGQNGSASASIPDKTVTDAIAKAQTDAKAQNKTANGIAVALNISMPQGATTLMATLTRSSLNALVSTGVTDFSINGTFVTVSFDKKALAEIQKQSSGNVTITIKPVQNLSAAAKKLIGTRPVYDVTVSYVKDGKAVNITSLGTGSATLSFPYTPGKNEAVGYLFGIYVDGKGNASRIPGSAYDVNSGSILLTTDHLSVYGVGYTSPTEKYTDIANHWAKESIDYAVGRGLFSGTTEKTFSPNTAMDRGMLVTVLGRLAGADVSAYKTSSFSDVAAGKYYLPYVEWAYKKGIISGIGNGKFAPERAVTGEEIALILQNYAKATGYKLPVTREAITFADNSSISSTYANAIRAMQQAGIMVGGSGNKFNPKAGATRAEVAAMLHRYVKLTVDPATAQGWALNDDGRYMYYKDGKPLTGWQTIDGKKYYFYNTGVLQTGWVKDGSNWRFYSGNKALVGWWNIGANGNNKRYYFDVNAVMVSGKWLQIDGKWYYFYSDGSLAKDTKIDVYEIGPDGVRKAK